MCTFRATILLLDWWDFCITIAASDFLRPYHHYLAPIIDFSSPLLVVLCLVILPWHNSEEFNKNMFWRCTNAISSLPLFDWEQGSPLIIWGPTLAFASSWTRVEHFSSFEAIISTSNCCQKLRLFSLSSSCGPYAFITLTYKSPNLVWTTSISFSSPLSLNLIQIIIYGW